MVALERQGNLEIKLIKLNPGASFSCLLKRICAFFCSFWVAAINSDKNKSINKIEVNLNKVKTKLKAGKGISFETF